MVTCKNNVIFSDKAFKLLLKTDIGRRYIALIISFLTKENLHTLENNLSLFSEEIALISKSIDSTTDVIYKYYDTFYNIEINNFYGKAKQVQLDSYKYLLFLRKLKKAKEYKDMNNIYQISIDQKDIFHDHHFTYQIVRKDLDSNKELSYDFIKDYHINLDYIGSLSYNEIMNCRGLERYLYFLVCDDKEFLKELYEGDIFMSELMDEAKRISDDYEIKLYCRPSDEELRQMDEEVYREEGYSNGYDSGYDTGLNNGRIEEKHEIVINMHKENIPIETIAKCTNLSCEDVMKVIEEESK